MSPYSLRGHCFKAISLSFFSYTWTNSYIIIEENRNAKDWYSYFFWLLINLRTSFFSSNMLLKNKKVLWKHWWVYPICKWLYWHLNFITHLTNKFWWCGIDYVGGKEWHIDPYLFLFREGDFCWLNLCWVK